MRAQRAATWELSTTACSRGQALGNRRAPLAEGSSASSLSGGPPTNNPQPKPKSDERLVDLAICLGASWIWGGHRGTLRELRRITRPGGSVLVGEPYWIHDPDPAYLAASELTADICSTIDGNLAIGREEGLTPLYVMPSRLEDWDRYEFLQLRAAERYAVANPADPDVPELLERVHRERDGYLRWGRDTLGWAIYLFRRPG